MGDSCGRVLEWELGLPDAGELIPLSHSLISPTLAAAFQISLPDRRSPDDDGQAAASPISHLSWEEEEGEEEEPGDCHLVGGGSRGGRGLGGGKKRRMVWTPELHHRFVAAVAHLGPKGAVPKAIVQLMNVEGLTRENVASHLQKYRLYLKRMPANSGTSSSAMRGDQSSPPPAPQEEQRPVPRIGGWASHSALAPFAGVGHCHQPPLSAGQHVTGYYAYDFSWPRAKNVDCDSEQLLRWKETQHNE